MFRTYKCSSSGRLVHRVLWYFFHAENIIEGYMNMYLILHTLTNHTDFYYNFSIKELPQNSMYKSSWGWTLGCSKHVENTMINLTFRWPCMVMNSYKINQSDALISQIYFWNKTLHVSGSSSVHHQEFFTVHTALVYGIQVCWCVQWKTPDDGQRNCPKHVEFYSKNKFEKLVHLVWFYYMNESFNFLNIFSKNAQTQNFVKKIYPLGDELLHADGQTDGHDEAFRNFANAPKKKIRLSDLYICGIIHNFFSVSLCCCLCSTALQLVRAVHLDASNFLCIILHITEWSSTSGHLNGRTK